MGELPIVERLRAWDEYGEYDILTESRPSRLRNPNGPEAALLITELVAALEPFGDETIQLPDEDGAIAGYGFATWKIRRARAVLARARSKGGE
jgi:hypothetical protein